ncbi:MAG: flagellar hook-length control protein FliK [Myxococcota bacterium]
MSRIDDERDAARVAERIALQRREEEQKAKDRASADSAFAKLVGQQKEAKAKAQRDAVGRSAVEKLLEEQEGQRSGEAAHTATSTVTEKGQARSAAARGRGALERKAFEATLKEGSTAQEKRAEAGKNVEVAESSHRGEAHAAEGRAEGRRGDARAGSDVLNERREEGAHPGQPARGGAPAAQGELQADADKGGGQGGQKKDEKPSDPLGGGFRFNPALMAPVPVAQAKKSSGSDRLRALASEIAQKIVERVRVGTNAAGRAEFQIDLRSEVLSGLSIKVSSSGGKIAAVFSGSDREVMKLLREQQEALEQALTRRGLQVEELRIEDRA